MKSRFTTFDIRAIISELEEKYQGMRVLNVYDIDSKTYLIKLAKPDKKAVILLESGIRIHSTDFEWPKNMTPSSFSMKLRKHLRTRRLEKVTQLGIDRIVDLQFGSSEAAYHVILELYDRGNIVLTDHEYTILNILRPRTDHSEDVRFVVHEKYPVESAKQPEGLVSQERLMSVLLAAKDGDTLKKTLNPALVYGQSLIEHCLVSAGIPSNAKIGTEFHITEDMPKLMVALENAETILHSSSSISKGYITQKKEKKTALNAEQAEELLTYFEFHPFLFKQHEESQYVSMESFDKAVDEFFSKIGSQKLDMKTLQQERAALKKLEHVKHDHEKRLQELKRDQGVDMNKAHLVEMNLDLVDRAIRIVCSAIANQIDWEEIHTLVKEAQSQGDPVASAIKTLKLDTNHITMFLKDPYLDSDEEADPEEQEVALPMKVDIDLALSAYANARKYFDKKRKAAFKEQKTVDASSKALKSAEKKTLQMLKDVQTVATINKARKTYWFEKFLWFVSSENFVVIGGRDQQQNELIVKKYLNPGDLYVHADLHGASSIIIKNPTGEPVPPKTLNEAGTMALCNSAAWDAKVVTSAWWVHHHQVTKTAPSGEYLTTGSFMIRGKKNFLPPSYLIYGFAFLFKLDEDSAFRHQGERRIKTLDDDTESVISSVTTDATEGDSADTEQELTADVSSGSDTEDETSRATTEPLHTINEGEEADKTETGDQAAADEEDGDEEERDEEEDGDEAADGEDDKDNKDKDEDSEQESDSMFPDTNIGLQYVQGERLRVQASRSDSRTTSTGSTEQEVEPDADPSNSGQARRLSAKQRREMKRKVKLAQMQGVTEDLATGSTPSQTQVHVDLESPAREDPDPRTQGDNVTQDEDTEDTNSTKDESTSDKKPQQQQPQPPKRGQKAKLKKVKEKYKDQDEEERRLRMEILASAGPQKEPKKKGKKGKQQGRPQSGPGQRSETGQGQTRPGQGQKLQGSAHPWRKLTIDDIKQEAPSIGEDGTSGPPQLSSTSVKDENVLSEEEKHILLEEENILLGQDVSELELLTGLPVAEDILHFCIPVAGPYSALLNYKYKVKLTPGSTKRGKAAKTAVHSFMHDRSTSTREKDLFKSLKDVDLSRNIPGKVKVSAPNLLKQKKK